MIRVSLFLCALASPAAAEWDYCYFGEAPDDVKRFDQQAPSPFFGFEYAMVPFAVKTLCSLPTEAEANTIRQIYTGLGCTPGSDIGQDIEAQLAITDRALILEGMLGTTEEPDFSAPHMQELCQVADQIGILPFQWTADQSDQSLTADQQAALDAQLPLWQRLFELFETMPQG